MSNTNLSSLTCAFQRLKNIDWSYIDFSENLIFGVELFREYLRRMACWITFLRDNGAENIDSFSWFYCDIASLLVPEIELPPHIIDYLRDNVKASSDLKTCLSYLHWNAVEEKTIKSYLLTLPPPYETAIMMYERGFYFREESDGLEVNRCLLPRKNIQYYLNLDPLELER